MPSATRGFRGSVEFALAALAVSAIPERAKRDGWAAEYASPAAHVVSGWVEALTSATLFVVGLLRYAAGFNRGAGWTYVVHRPTLTYGDFFGVGALGYLSYLLTPVAWLTVYCFAEGIVRALDAALSRRMLGIALVALPWRLVGTASRGRERARLARRLGPERPDEVIAWEGSAVALTVLASRRKPWAPHQVIRYGDGFFRLLGVTAARQGGHEAFRYDFGHLEPREVIRGAVLEYTPGGRPAGASAAESATPPEAHGRT